MRTIYKFILQIREQILFLSKEYKILTVQVQGKDICLWAEINTPSTTSQIDEVRIAIYGTGNPIPEDHVTRSYIGTVQQDGLVWHIYQLLDDPGLKH